MQHLHDAVEEKVIEGYMYGFRGELPVYAEAPEKL